MSSKKRIPICVDFDGTCVEHKYPEVGNDVPHAVETLNRLHAEGFDIVLFTMRSGESLVHAVDWFADHEIPLIGVNVNPTQKKWTQSPKAYGRYYVDDAAVGVPLIYPNTGRPYVDWLSVWDEIMLREDIEQ